MSPEQASALHQRLRDDPARWAALQRAAGDRVRVRDLMTTLEAQAPGRTTQQAVSLAERQDLFDAAERGPARRRRLAAGIGIALLLGGSIGGAAFVVNWKSAPPERGLAGKAAPRPLFGVPELDEAPPAPAPLPSFLGRATDVGVRPSGELRGSDELVAPRAQEESPFAQTQRLAAEDALIDRWGREVERKVEDELASAGRANLVVGGMAIAEAAKLALEGRLRITTVAGDLSGSLRRAQFMASTGQGVRIPDGAAESRSSGRSFTIELTARQDPDLLALQDAIVALVEGLATDGFGGRVDVRLSAIPADEPGAGGAIPSFRAEDVLWFARPVSAWEPTFSVRAPVEVVERGERGQSAAPR